MKNLNVLIKKLKWQDYMAVCVFLIVTLPTLKIYWMLLDDGVSLWYARKIIEDISNFNWGFLVNVIFEDSGRIRPVYWVYHTTAYLIGGHNFVIHRIIHVLLFALIFFLIFKIVQKITKSKTAALISSTIFLFCPLNYENLMRLGTVEPQQTVLLLLITYLTLINVKIWIAFIALFLALLTKEITFAIFPSIMFVFFFGSSFQTKSELQKYRNFFYYSVVVTFLFVAVLLVNKKGYGENYVFTVQAVKTNLFLYSKLLFKGIEPFLTLAFSSFLFRLIKNFPNLRIFIKNKANMFELYFLIIIASFLVIQTPWRFFLERYLMPEVVFAAIFIGIEFNTLFSKLYIFLKDKKKLYRLFYSLFILYFVYYSIISIYQILAVTQKYYSGWSVKYLTHYLAETVPKSGVVLMNLPKANYTLEHVFEMGLHLSEIEGRDDIKVEYLNLNNLPVSDYYIVGSQEITPGYDEKELNKIFGSNRRLFEYNNKILVFTTPINLVKQVIKKIIFALIGKEPFNHDGIYAYYINSSSWYVYKPE